MAGGWLDNLSKLAQLMGTVGGPLLMTGNRKSQQLGALMGGLGGAGELEQQWSEANRNKQAFQNLLAPMLGPTSNGMNVTGKPGSTSSGMGGTPDQQKIAQFLQGSQAAGVPIKDLLSSSAMSQLLPQPTEPEKKQWMRAGNKWSYAAPTGASGEEPLAAYEAEQKAAAEAQKGAGKRTPHWVMEADEHGTPIVVKHVTDAEGNDVSTTTEGRGRVSLKASDQLQAVGEAEDAAKGLRDDYAKILPKYKKGGATELAKQWALYNPTTNFGGWAGEVDPDWANWFSHVGQMKTNLLTAAGGGSRNLHTVNQLFGKHVVSEYQDPVALMDRLQAFEKGGRFDAIKSTILPPIAGLPGGSPPSGATPTPPDASPPPSASGIKWDAKGNAYRKSGGKIEVSRDGGKTWQSYL